MHIDFIVEEPSAEAAMENLLPQLIAGRATYKIVSFQSKHEMLRKIPLRLEGYKFRITREELFIVILIDEDRENCLALKAKLETLAAGAGLITKTAAAPTAHFNVVNRIIIEELEAWFFGDITALREAYPKISKSIDKRAGYRDPDSIQGGTWEALHRVLKSAGYYRDYLPKIEVAHRVSQHMVPARNKSGSFRVFCSAVEAIF